MSTPTHALNGERHTEPITVSCPLCLRETKLTIAKRNARKFIGEWCDGAPRARHRLVQMLGPHGEPNR